jgi:hypothetical protein
MTKELQSHLSELEKLKGIRIVMTDDQQPLSIGLSYQEKTPGEEALAWMWWTAVAILYGICGLILWRAVT